MDPQIIHGRVKNSVSLSQFMRMKTEMHLVDCTGDFFEGNYSREGFYCFFLIKVSLISIL